MKMFRRAFTSSIYKTPHSTYPRNSYNNNNSNGYNNYNNNNNVSNYERGKLHTGK